MFQFRELCGGGKAVDHGFEVKMVSMGEPVGFRDLAGRF